MWFAYDRTGLGGRGNKQSEGWASHNPSFLRFLLEFI